MSDELDLDYTAKDLTDDELAEKITDLTWKVDPMKDELANLEAEVDLLIEEKNKRYQEKKIKESGINDAKN